MDICAHRRGLAAALIATIALTSQLACSSPQQPAASSDTGTTAVPDDTQAPPEPVPIPDIQPPPASTQTPVQAPAPDAPASNPAPPIDPSPMPSTPRDQTPTPPAEPVTVVIYALSRGKGVPSETRATYKQIHALMEQRKDASAITRLESSRMGLEGETRLCVEFRDREQADAALADIRKLAAGADLLTIVEEPCPGYKGSKP